MNKQEYLEHLEACLKHKMSREEIEDIMRDYAEYFEEGRRQSKQDSEISAKLGDPELVAQQLIEESKEQYAELHSTAKAKEKKMPWEYAGEQLKSVKNKFQDWDHGEGKKKSEKKVTGSTEEDVTETPVKENTLKMEKRTKEKEKYEVDNLLLRTVKCLGRGFRWCIYAGIAFMLVVVAATASLGMLAVGMLGMSLLAGTLILSAFMVLLCIFGIILSGFVFVIFGTWTGIAVLSGTVAGIGLSALAVMLLFRGTGAFWKFCKDIFYGNISVWNRMLHKIEGWLIISTREKVCDDVQPETKKQTVQEKEMIPPEEAENSEEVKRFPTTMPAQIPQEESSENRLEAGKEGF